MNVKEIRELVCDMNAIEIAVHIAHSDLHEWLGRWRAAVLMALMEDE